MNNNTLSEKKCTCCKHVDNGVHNVEACTSCFPCKLRDEKVSEQKECICTCPKCFPARMDGVGDHCKDSKYCSPQPLQKEGDSHDKFWAKVNKTESCWLWTGALVYGYGTYSSKSKSHRAHRYAYELIKGVIPEGKVLDHLCRVRNCVNPDHLEPVTDKENILRGTGASARNIKKTKCPRGHEYVPENIYIQPSKKDGRICLICKRIQLKEYRKRIKEDESKKARREYVLNYHKQYHRKVTIPNRESKYLKNK